MAENATHGGTGAESVCTGDTPHCYCPITGVVDTLSKKYAMQVICAVGAHGTLRFSALEEHLDGPSTRTLSNRLAELVERDLLTRTQYDEVPPRVEYELTDEGAELQRRLEPLLAWADGRE